MKTKKLKIGVGLWCVSFASDRFVVGGYRPIQSIQDQIKIVSRIQGAESFDLHTSDFAGAKPKDIGKMADDLGLKINAVNPNIFGDTDFKYGAFTNTDKKLRQKAIDLVKSSLDTAMELKANVSSLWPGQDGYDYLFQNDYNRQWDGTVGALQEICDYAPAFKICYEYKPKEPRMFSLVENAGKALSLMHDVDRKNIGIVLDYGHSLFARENAAATLCFIDRAGKLFNVHFNDAYGNWDDDLMAGTANVWSNLEFFWYLKKSTYDGYVTLDMFPYREDPFEACSLAVRMIKTFEQIVEGFDDGLLQKLQNKNDAAAIFEYLRRKVLLRE
jgi:xylose isomerase